MLCWFCSIREAESKHALDFKMHSVLNAKKDELETKVAYNVKQIIIPRCADCHSRHIRVRFTSIYSFFVTIVLLAAVLASLTGWTAAWLWGVGLGLATGLLAGLLAIRYYALKGIRSVRNAKTDFPEAKTLLESGYKVGWRPKKLPENYFSGDGDNE